jgi:hypothetical protein
MDFGLVASNTLTVTFTLGKFVDPEVQLGVGSFKTNIGLGLSLVLSLTTAAELTGGFQLCIPDGSQLGFNLDLDLNPVGGIGVDSSVQTL